MYYSRTTNGFYPELLKADYEKTDTWPSDAVELTDEEAETYQGQQPPAGKMLGSDADGRPVWVDLPEPTQEELNAQRVTEIDARLKAIDVESVRPLRAINAGTDTQEDIDKLEALDAEAETLRQERAGLV